MDQCPDRGPTEVPNVQTRLGVPVDKGTSGKVVSSSGGKSSDMNSIKKSKQSRSAQVSVDKYYFQRHRLFHQYDDGIQLDEQSWYSVTPEKIAAHHADRFVESLADENGSPLVLVDAFCGAGGNTIQLAFYSYVIAVDISRERIDMARHNAKVYGVDAYIEFILGDVREVLPAISSVRYDSQDKRSLPLVPDGIFLSPPWGGPNYQNIQEYDVEQFVPFVRLASMVSKNVAILLPRTASESAVQRYFGPCEYERNYLSGTLKTVTLYFGKLVSSPSNEER